jgi:hypothetical protein
MYRAAAAYGKGGLGAAKGCKWAVRLPEHRRELIAGRRTRELSGMGSKQHTERVPRGEAVEERRRSAPVSRPNPSSRPLGGE